MSDIQIRDLTAIDEFRQVIALEKAIWGYTDEGDLVTVPVFIFTVHRGASSTFGTSTFSTSTFSTVSTFGTSTFSTLRHP